MPVSVVAGRQNLRPTRDSEQTQALTASTEAGPSAQTQRIERVVEPLPAASVAPTTTAVQSATRSHPPLTPEPATIVNPRLAELVERSAGADARATGSHPGGTVTNGSAPNGAIPNGAIPNGSVLDGDAGPNDTGPDQTGPVRRSTGNTVAFWTAAVVFWLGALLAGVACAVAAGGRRVSPCSKNASSVGCTTTGSALSVVMLLVVIAVVGVVTVYAFDVRRQTRRWAGVLGAGLAVLVVLAIAAWLIIRSIH